MRVLGGFSRGWEERDAMGLSRPKKGQRDMKSGKEMERGVEVRRMEMKNIIKMSILENHPLISPPFGFFFFLSNFFSQ